MVGIISNTGAILIYLPPYSPELNPIGVFAIVKQWLSENQEVLLITDDIISVVFQAFLQVSKENVQSLYEHSGY